MSILAVSRLPRELDGSHVMCRRCGIIRARCATNNKLANYTCRDCTPYWKEDAA